MNPADENYLLREALSEIRGVVLDSPLGKRKSLCAINDIVGYALFGDSADSPHVAPLVELRADQRQEASEQYSASIEVLSEAHAVLARLLSELA